MKWRGLREVRDWFEWLQIGLHKSELSEYDYEDWNDLWRKTLMSLELRGKNISGSEVTAVGRDGFWLIHEDREYFVPFNSYPVFRQATVGEIFGMQEIAPGQLRWESLDADIELEALNHPEHFPLKFI